MADHDLQMNKLCPTDKYVFSLFQDGNIFLFHIRELVKIIQYSISNANFFFIEPLSIKNPFNNVLLNKSSLYNIYFFVTLHNDKRKEKETYINVKMELFTLFFKTNFDITKLIRHHKYTLREYAIKNYLNKS